MERMINRYNLGEEVVHIVSDTQLKLSKITMIDIGMKNGFTHPEVRYNKLFYGDEIICLSSIFNKINQ